MKMKLMEQRTKKAGTARHDASSVFGNLIIRKVNESDLIELEWGDEYRHFRYLYRDVYKKMLQGKTIMWVAENPEQGILGQIFVDLRSSKNAGKNTLARAYLFSIRVKAAFRNQGLGTLLVKYAEQQVSKRGFSQVYLFVGKTNLDAIRFYRRMGYTIMGEVAGNWSYFDENGHFHHVHDPSWRMFKFLFL